MIERLIYRSRPPKFKKRPKRRVWRTPKATYMVDPSDTAYSYAFPTVSPRRWRWLGRREVYPHALHVHLVFPLHDEDAP